MFSSCPEVVLVSPSTSVLSGGIWQWPVCCLITTLHTAFVTFSHWFGWDFGKRVSGISVFSLLQKQEVSYRCSLCRVGPRFVKPAENHHSWPDGRWKHSQNSQEFDRRSWVCHARDRLSNLWWKTMKSATVKNCETIFRCGLTLTNAALVGCV